MRRLLQILACLLCLSSSPAISQEIAIGDSIAVGLNLPGDAAVGRSPKAVVAALAMVPVEKLKGKVVILSTGLSNDPSQLDQAVLQLQMLHWAGAKVILLGVGTRVQGLEGYNDWLKLQALARDFIFVSGWPGVHPDNYRVLLLFIRKEECRLYRVCAV